MSNEVLKAENGNGQEKPSEKTLGRAWNGSSNNRDVEDAP